MVTKEKIYFQLGKIDNIEDVKSLRLFYSGENDIVYTIYSCQDCDDISLIDTVGNDQYFNYNDLEYIIENMKIEIHYSNKTEVVKLKFIRDFSNNRIFSKVKFKNNKPSNNKSYLNFEILNSLKNILIKADDGFNLTKEINNKDFSINLLDNVLYLEIDDNGLVENFTYFFQFNSLGYDRYNDNQLDSSFIINFSNNTCESEFDDCNDKENIIIKFNLAIKELLNLGN